MYLRPSEIRFSQDSINNVFDEKSSHARVRIGETLDDLVNGYITVDDIPTISVAKRNDDWYTSDNRRLWVFRNLESLGKCRQIPVREVWSIPFNKLTTDCDGITIRVRRNPGGRWHNNSSTIVNNSKSNFKQRGNTESNRQVKQNRLNDLVSQLSPMDTNYAMNPRIVDQPSIFSTGNSAAVTGPVGRQPFTMQNIKKDPIPTNNKAVIDYGQNYGHSQTSVNTRYPGQYTTNANRGSEKSATSADSSSSSSVSEKRNRPMTSNRGDGVQHGLNSTDNGRHSAYVISSATPDDGLRIYTDNPTFPSVRTQSTSGSTTANRKNTSYTRDESNCCCVVQ